MQKTQIHCGKDALISKEYKGNNFLETVIAYKTNPLLWFLKKALLSKNIRWKAYYMNMLPITMTTIFKQLTIITVQNCQWDWGGLELLKSSELAGLMPIV